MIHGGSEGGREGFLLTSVERLHSSPSLDA